MMLTLLGNELNLSHGFLKFMGTGFNEFSPSTGDVWWWWGGEGFLC